ncbi:hypothetical protein FBZ84_13536, partial [Azospirillum baldaniorum]
MPTKDFLPWQTVYWRFRRLVRRLLFRKIHDLALMLDRKIEGRAVSPTTAFLDSTPLTGLALQLRFAPVGLVGDRLMTSPPGRPSDDDCG